MFKVPAIKLLKYFQNCQSQKKWLIKAYENPKPKFKLDQLRKLTYANFNAYHMVGYSTTANLLHVIHPMTITVPLNLLKTVAKIYHWAIFKYHIHNAVTKIALQQLTSDSEFWNTHSHPKKCFFFHLKPFFYFNFMLYRCLSLSRSRNTEKMKI